MEKYSIIKNVHIAVDDDTWLEFMILCRRAESNLRTHLANYVKESVKAGRLLLERRDEG